MILSMQIVAAARVVEICSTRQGCAAAATQELFPELMQSFAAVMHQPSSTASHRQAIDRDHQSPPLSPPLTPPSSEDAHQQGGSKSCCRKTPDWEPHEAMRLYGALLLLAYSKPGMDPSLLASQEALQVFKAIMEADSSQQARYPQQTPRSGYNGNMRTLTVIDDNVDCTQGIGWLFGTATCNVCSGSQGPQCNPCSPWKPLAVLQHFQMKMS